MPIDAELPPVLDPELARRLEDFARGAEPPAAVLPWAERLAALDYNRLLQDLTLVLQEPHTTAEPVDWRELEDILREYADLAGWEGPLAVMPGPTPESLEAPYRVEIRSEELRALEHASAAVQQTARDLLARFLPFHPTAVSKLERGRLKKLGNRGIWQIDLPDGYRVRYLVAELERTVYVVYLGPHPEGDEDGREQVVRAMVRRRRHGGD